MHVAPIEPNKNLMVFPDRGIHPLSGDFKYFDVKWLFAEIKGDYNLVFGISAFWEFADGNFQKLILKIMKWLDFFQAHVLLG